MKSFLLPIFLGCLLFSGNAVAATDRPNIVFILVDDLGYADLGCQGSDDIRTPRIDSLAKQGIRFTDAYVTAPQCGPSRAGIVTGLNQARFGYLDNKGHSGLPDPDVLPLMPEIIRSAGYRTGLVGKWHIGQGTEYLIEQRGKEEDDLLPPKRIAAAKPWLRRFDEGLFIVGGGGYYFPFKAPFSKHPCSHFYSFQGADAEPSEFRLGEEAYKTDFLTDAALEFIGKAGDEKEPFFLYLSYTSPHTPLQAKEEDIQANSHIEDNRRRIFAGMMTCLDGNIGRVLDLLEEKGLRENTLIAFLSDNGGPTSQNTSRNDPFTGIKGDVHEGGIRVPFILSWPGVFPEGTIYSQPVSSLDLIPTFAAAAGAELNAEIEYDGVDLLPYLAMDSTLDTAPHEKLFWRWRNYRALRSGDFKWLDARSPGRTKPTYGLFNLAESEVESGATLLEAPERLQGMEEAHEAYWSTRLDEWTPRD